MYNNYIHNNNHLDLFWYKIFKCKDKNCKISNKCFYYHNKTDKRRRIYKNIIYYPKKCECTFKKLFENKKCDCKKNCKCIGIYCKFSHNLFEILYHPSKYKTQICKNYNDCKFGIFCCNAHSLKELKIELYHNFPFDNSFFIFKFKTEFCPIIENHQKKFCVYAHNFEEFRRKPNNLIKNKKCGNWGKNNIIPNIYTEKCNYDCNKCHGWKEYDYHPKNYKVINCIEKNYHNCKFRFLCPRNHKNNNEEIRNNDNFLIFESKKNLKYN